MVKDHRTKEQVGDVEPRARRRHRRLHQDLSDEEVERHAGRAGAGRRCLSSAQPASVARVGSDSGLGVRRSSSAAGILLTRLTGLVRQRVFAHYFGLGVEADAFSAAFRIPNFLQNLFGEGALSASFIPVYASLVARGEPARGRPRRRRRRRRCSRWSSACSSWSACSPRRCSSMLIAPGLRRREARADDSSSSASCFRAPGCWCCRPGASAS